METSTNANGLLGKALAFTTVPTKGSICKLSICRETFHYCDCNSGDIWASMNDSSIHVEEQHQPSEQASHTKRTQVELYSRTANTAKRTSDLLIQHSMDMLDLPGSAELYECRTLYAPL